MGDLLIGTSGYDYKEWKGLFYPEKLAHARFLEYYASQFNSLELNGTYYRMPTQEQMRKMYIRSNGQLMFTVKAFQDLTHAAEKSHFQPMVAEFKKALEPLLAEHKLLCALFQFPQSFHYEKEERIYLDKLLNEVRDIPVVVEMRNAKWQNDQVYNALRQRRVGWAITDNPKLNELLKLDYVSTSDIAYMRFHGRNAKMWYDGDNVSRYDYMYSDEELEEFVEPVKYLLQHVNIVQLFFNNHAKSQATINARKIALLLR
ncbi:MAG: DUF72 domain-containing protein [Treponema sp.]|jgi:uncharacterized protein YecE (DUF72 family)|nr:DUF72 domain-containing protein [Treponema sp.]